MHTYCCTVVPLKSISDSKLRVFLFVADECALKHNQRWQNIEAWADKHLGFWKHKYNLLIAVVG